jgi:hypothetical protein
MLDMSGAFHAAPRLHHASRQHAGCTAPRGARAAPGNTCDWIFERPEHWNIAVLGDDRKHSADWVYFHLTATRNGERYIRIEPGEHRQIG